MSSPRNTAAHGLVKRWTWLDALGTVFGAIVGGFYRLPGTRPLKTLLHGTWPLNHPLHPLLTDATVGGYTALVAVDAYILVTGETALVRIADFLLVASFITSLGSIASGLTDWNETYAEERRTGMLHGLLMLVASSLFVVSLFLRVGGAAEVRTAAVAISTVAWLILAAASYLGGEMVFGYGTQVNRQAWTEPPAKWERLEVVAAGLEDRKPVVARTKKGFDVFVARLDGAIYAIGNTCTHAGGPLNEGTWVGADRCEIQCPWHASRFSVRDGHVSGGPATFGEPRLETRVNENGFIEVRAAG